MIDKSPLESTVSDLLLNLDTGTALYRILDIGNNKSIKLTDFIDALQKSIRKKAMIDNKPMQEGDVKSTHADVKASEANIDYTL